MSETYDENGKKTSKEEAPAERGDERSK